MALRQAPRARPRCCRFDRVVRPCAGSRPLAASNDAARAYPNWAALPVQPGATRRTTRSDAGGGVYLFEQQLGVLDVLVNIRMTVVRLKSGGLFVHAPVAPTRECRSLLAELGGEVQYVVLPTSAVEHKVFFGPFVRCYPACKCYAVPGQWSFPLNLPLSLLGLFPRSLDGTLGNDSRLSDGEAPPWAGEIDHALLQLSLGLGPFVEAAFYVRASRTLLVTDALVAVPAEPPAVCGADPRALLVRAKAASTDPPLQDTRAARAAGWAKTVLFALFFQPADVSFSPLTGFRWSPTYEAAFERLVNVRQRVFVAPILQNLVLDKQPGAVRAWVASITSWPFVRVIPAHLAAPVAARPDDVRAAFSFLDVAPARGGAPPGGAPPQWLDTLRTMAAALTGKTVVQADVSPFGDQDVATIRSINRVLTQSGIIKK